MAVADMNTTVDSGMRSPTANEGAIKTVRRLKSQELMQQAREVEIDHEGRVYRLRITQLNKLILTA